MSDFIARVAARAVGESSGARPRLPGVFGQGRAAADAGIEIVDEEVVAHTPLPPGRAATSVETMRASEAVGSPVPGARIEPLPAEEPSADQFRADEPPTRPVTGGLRGTADRSVVDAPARPRAAVPPQIGERDDREAGRVAPSPEPEPPSPDSAVSAVAARPVRARPAAPPPDGRGTVSSADAAMLARDAPQPVRVHIGRLEVRANLQEAPSTHRHRKGAPAPPEGLSLSDYLRGKREVG